MLKFLNALAALAAVGTFVIAFLDSYEVTTPETGRPRSKVLTRGASFSIDIVSRIAQPIRDILKTQMRAYARKESR